MPFPSTHAPSSTLARVHASSPVASAPSRRLAVPPASSAFSPSPSPSSRLYPSRRLQTARTISFVLSPPPPTSSIARSSSRRSRSSSWRRRGNVGIVPFPVLASRSSLGRALASPTTSDRTRRTSSTARAFERARVHERRRVTRGRRHSSRRREFRANFAGVWCVPEVHTNHDS